MLLAKRGTPTPRNGVTIATWQGVSRELFTILKGTLGVLYGPRVFDLR